MPDALDFIIYDGAAFSHSLAIIAYCPMGGMHLVAFHRFRIVEVCYQHCIIGHFARILIYSHFYGTDFRHYACQLFQVFFHPLRMFHARFSFGTFLKAPHDYVS